ncbi:hypothetical protein LMH87_007472 [Akanthomyces muscarius]|uniref:Uncharacterized protein n=1 Tax=Akanthomyces muscarius TaxID=2231603 RepID=A0A9W8URD4_AKAMU|nr:hypothetical protein LMH87_007472 [Akanthomyces muscarius]KAJ4165862.1 hypothetical protein LMH87_007472 [Akanthomyces muscarius]
MTARRSMSGQIFNPSHPLFIHVAINNTASFNRPCWAILQVCYKPDEQITFDAAQEWALIPTYSVMPANRWIGPENLRLHLGGLSSLNELRTALHA